MATQTFSGEDSLQQMIKKGILISPTSQASTAPGTPFQATMLDPLGVLPEGIFSRATSGDWPLSRTTSVEDEVPVSPRLQSDLGKWARAEVQADENAERISSIGMPPLMSELGQWAESVIRAEQYRESQSQKPTRSYVVDNGQLQAHSVGIEYRLSKNLQHRDTTVLGPEWGSVVRGIDTGDGWLVVGDRFLPMTLDGVKVLTLKPHDTTDKSEEHRTAMKDGPSLAADGRALDLDGGASIFFSHDRELALGCAAGRVARGIARAARAQRAAEQAHAAEQRVLAEEVCSLDIEGTLRGCLDKAQMPRRAERLKAIHRRRLAGKRDGCGDETVLCIDGHSGRAFITLHLCRTMRGEYRRAVARRRCRDGLVTNHSQSVFAVDSTGVVRDIGADDVTP